MINIKNKFKTVYKFGTGKYIEKKSKFISHVMPVDSEEEAQQFIEKIKKEYYNATHNVYAYQIGFNSEIRRYSDDGEPSQTAGIPILTILEGEDLKNTLVVVTRYFGGTLLGTGGLVRSYQSATKEGIKDALIIEKTLMQKMSVKTNYSLSGKVQFEILNNEHIIFDTKYTDIVEYIVLIEDTKLENFITAMANLSSGTIKPVFLEYIYTSYVNKKLVLFNVYSELRVKEE